MTIDLNAIRKRSEAATEGPWTTFDDVQYIARRTVYEYDEWTESNVDVIADCSHMHDAAFIAHARQDVPALIELVAQKQAEVERLRTQQERLIAELEKADKFSDELRAELFRQQLPGIQKIVEDYVNQRKEDD